MKFSVFNAMPYGQPRERTDAWPVPNGLFDPERGIKAAQECLDLVQLEDELGYDWISCAEHHYSPGSLAPNVSVLASALTQRVKRAKIAILGALIPLSNPVRIAEEYAMIDALSGGRLVAGLLRGAPYEYLVYSVPPAESRARFEEAWELIVRAWTDTQPFGWEGKHYKYRYVSIWPRPIQQPMPPLYVSGSSQDSGEFAARHRVGLGLAFTILPLAAAAAKFYRQKAAENGWEPTPDQIIYQVPIHVAETDEQAFAHARPFVEGAHLARGMLSANKLVASAGFFGQRDEKLTQRFQHMGEEQKPTVESAINIGAIVCGGPDNVAKQIKRLHDEIGFGVLNLIFDRMSPPDQKVRSIELFAKEVMPRVRAL
jgi:alkanesulfonate monooxygenase SsuD/methylene tetrahydromethanopterin reductase-like flavin-dependent oxidoreductase (luciferase family)